MNTLIYFIPGSKSIQVFTRHSMPQGLTYETASIHNSKKIKGKYKHDSGVGKEVVHEQGRFILPQADLHCIWSLNQSVQSRVTLRGHRTKSVLRFMTMTKLVTITIRSEHGQI